MTEIEDQAVQILSNEGAQCGDCGDEPGDRVCPDCEKYRARYVAALVAAGWAPKEQPPAGRAAFLREAADICDEAGAVYAAKELNDQAGAAYALMERFLRKADEAEYVATPCSPGGCEPGGEPCSTHERLMAHGEGDHELCEPDCGTTDGESRDIEAVMGPADGQQKMRLLADLRANATPVPARTDPYADGICTFGEDEAPGAGCIKPAGHGGAHLVTPGDRDPSDD